MVQHSRKLSVVDFDGGRTMLVNGLRLSEANSADLWVGENDRWDILIQKFGGGKMRWAKDAITEVTSSGNCYCKTVSYVTGLKCSQMQSNGATNA